MTIFKANRKITSGQAAEQRACRYLKRAGLKIVATNYRAPRGEIDIVARDGESYVFVEVRLRSNPGYGGAGDSIVRRKQRRIIHAASHYLLKRGLWEKVPCRFDVICLDRHTCDGNYQLEWTANAFSAE